MTNIFNHIYKKRIPNVLDLKILLFFYCNLGCEFCTQYNDRKEGMNVESIKEKARIACEKISKTNKKYINVTVFGGEMFGDYVPSNVFHSYRFLLAEMQKEADKHDKILTITNFNNLFFRNTDRVLKLLAWCEEEGINFRFGISYDLVGRFTHDKHLELFKKNELIFSDYIVKFNTVMTSEALKVILRPKGINDPYFDYLYNKYEFGTRHYWKNQEVAAITDHTGWQHKSEQDLHDAYLYFYENYPKADGIQTFIDCIESKGQILHSDCPGDRSVILPSNETTYCINSPECEKGCIGDEYMKLRGCLSCPYLNACKVDCFFEEQDENIIKMDGCFYRKLYEEIEKRMENSPRNLS